MLQDLVANLGLKAMQDSALLNTNSILTEFSDPYLAENWKKKKAVQPYLQMLCLTFAGFSRPMTAQDSSWSRSLQAWYQCI